MYKLVATKKIPVAISLLLFSFFVSWILYVTEFRYRLLASLFVIAAIAIIAKLLKVTPQQMGIKSATLKRGVLTALPFMLAIITVMGIVCVVRPATFLDSRYNQSLGAMLYSVLIIIPLTTVLLEELFFRGLFLGYLLRETSRVSAVIVSSLAFGLWHFFVSKNVSLEGISVTPVLITAGVVAFTAAGGAFFAWLRIRGDNLIAPILIHWTVNVTGVVLSYIAWQLK